MAWLITLALFWALISLHAKGTDKANDHVRKKKAENAGRIQSIRGNIYTIAWQECENIQIEFKKTNPVVPDGETVLTYYAKLHNATSMQHEAVCRALADLRNRGQDVLKAGSCYGDTPIIIPANKLYDIEAEAEGVRGLLYPLFGPFNTSQAAHVTDERAQVIFKRIWNGEALGTNIVKWTKDTRDYW